MSGIDDGRVLYNTLARADLEAECDVGIQWSFLDDDRKEFYNDILSSLELDRHFQEMRS